MEKGILYTALKKVTDEHILRFHMPGHKGRGNPWHLMDYTEIPGTDNLHHPEGAILKTEEKLAAVYGSAEARILVGGTTNGLQSAIMGACREGESLLVPANCHRSVYAGLALGRVRGVYFVPETDSVLGFGAAVTPEQVRQQLALHPEVKGMVLVTPTYYGTASRTREIASILHEQDKFLIVDEAHGAHLRFCEGFPEDAVSAGADLVVQSTHKLLGALTQSSLLHMQGTRIDRERVSYFLTLLQSSSPSYPLMMSVEAAVDAACEHAAEVFGRIGDRWEACYRHQDDQAAITLYGDPDGRSYDRSKWLFRCRGCRGTELERRLRQEFQIQCELSGADHLLAMTGIGTAVSDLDRLQAAVAALNGQYCADTAPAAPAFVGHYEEAVPLHQALFDSRTERVKLSDSVGRAAGEMVIPYPPGIPALLPGSRITADTAAYLTALYRRGETVLGMTPDGRISVITEEG